MPKKCALFIDCENIPGYFLPQILEKLKNNYKLKIKKAYADWSLPSSWSHELLDIAGLEPIQVFHRNHKNSVDIKICLDALELSYESKIKVFAVVTDDSDFRHLVHKLASKNLKVLGFGTDKTPSDYRGVYHNFYLLKKAKTPANNENKSKQNISTNKTAKNTQNPAKKPNALQALLDKYKSQKAPLNRTLDEVLQEIILAMPCNNEYIGANQITENVRKNGNKEWKIKYTGFSGWAKLLKNTSDIFLHRYAGEKKILQIKLSDKIKQAILEKS